MAYNVRIDVTGINQMSSNLTNIFRISPKRYTETCLLLIINPHNQHARIVAANTSSTVTFISFLESDLSLLMYIKNSISHSAFKFFCFFLHELPLDDMREELT